MLCLSKGQSVDGDGDTKGTFQGWFVMSQCAYMYKTILAFVCLWKLLAILFEHILKVHLMMIDDIRATYQSLYWGNLYSALVQLVKCELKWTVE